MWRETIITKVQIIYDGINFYYILSEDKMKNGAMDLVFLLSNQIHKFTCNLLEIKKLELPPLANVNFLYLKEILMLIKKENIFVH